MHPVRTACLLLSASLLAAGSASAQTRWTDDRLTDEAGVPLFVSDAEGTSGKSQCYGACLGIWKPYLAPADARPAGDLGLARRDDGGQQWLWQGRPLYRWWNADKPLEGEGMRGGNWHTVRRPS